LNQPRALNPAELVSSERARDAGGPAVASCAPGVWRGPCCAGEWLGWARRGWRRPWPLV